MQIAKIEQDDNWKCFSCNQEPIRKFQAKHCAHCNYIKKQKWEINESEITEEEKETRRNIDLSKCCEISRRYLTSATESELEEESSEGHETNKANDLDGIPATASAETSQFASEVDSSLHRKLRRQARLQQWTEAKHLPLNCLDRYLG